MLRWIWNNLGSMVLALTLAIAVWVVATYEENPSVKGLFPEPIPIEVINKPEGMILWPEISEEVRVTIRAPRSSWENLSPNKFRAVIDLSGLTAGVHEVPVQVECLDRAVKILEKKPDKIGIRLEERREKEVAVRVEIMDNPPLGYAARTPMAIPPTVKVSGPASMVDQVAEVVAQLYLRDARETVKRSVALSARNDTGEPVGWVEIEPAEVQVQVPIEPTPGFKDVAVRVIWEGQVARGYRIGNVSVSPSIVTVVGSPSAIEKIPGYLETAPIDISNAREDVVERVPLNLPEGVTVLGEQGVLVEIKVTAIESSLTVHRKLTIQGLSPGLWATPSPDTVDVILSGPLPKLDALKPEDVRVVLDLFELEPGTHKVKPDIIAPEGLKVESVLPSTIEVEISVVPPTPTPTPVATETPTPTPALPAPTPTATPTPALLPQCPNPKARLTYPTVDAVLTGAVRIRGSAAIANFAYYKLEVRAEGAPEWSLLQRFEEPVTEGVLALWDTSSLSPGTYWLRLVVVDTTGNYPEPCQVRVIIK